MPYAQIDFDVLTDAHLSAGAKLFLAHLQRWDWGNGCWLTDRQLAREIGVSTRTVRNHTKALEEAGYLWVFEDREGMTVRLVVRPGHVYPAPKGLGKPFPKAGKKFSSPPIKDSKDFEITEETTCFPEAPVLGEAEPEAEAAVVVQAETDQTETPAPVKAPATAAVPPLAPATVPALSDAALTALAVLEEAGVARPAAVRLAMAYPVRQIRAATRYARQYRGEPLNAPGLVVCALKDGWTLPRWSYGTPSAPKARETGAPAAVERTQRPQEGRAAPGPSPEPHEADAAEDLARYKAEVWAWVDPLDDRPWEQIREGLTAEQRAYCEAEG